ncbi:MAG TPA: endonuclease/exonuclease/phosphatase family protein [Fimbriimonas sp.]|nr:endonuclease/exonuclease/phosphatase family protein [Fimbriimonas sp.]
MTYNIRGPWDRGVNAWENRRDALAELIRQESPDILGTQEGVIEQLDYIAEALPEYDWVGVAREDGDREGEHCAIFYRRSMFSLESSGTFWLSETPELPGSMSWNTACCRICTWAHFSGGLRVFNSHLDHISAEARLKGMQLILGRVGAGPAILMGDWNEGEDEPVYALCHDAAFIDTFRVVHSGAGAVATYTDFDPTAVNGPKIDYIQFRGPFQVLDSQIVRTVVQGRLPSDHFPVGATVEYGPADLSGHGYCPRSSERTLRKTPASLNFEMLN